jgi:tyramine---L-glutamate ligase
MKALIFEWLCGGGCQFDQICFADPDPGFQSIRAQGRMMAENFAEDLLSAGHTVQMLWDCRWETTPDLLADFVLVTGRDELQTVLLERARRAEAVFLIAPETGGRLLTVCQWLDQVNDRLFSPDAAFVQLTGSKKETCRRLAAQGVNVPREYRWSDLDPSNAISRVNFPVVAKPDDGAGSEGARLIRSLEDLARISHADQFHYEQFIPGMAVSVSVLYLDRSIEYLPATGQIFDAEPFGHYSGPEFPLAPQLAKRAKTLASKAVRALPRTRGYVGIDMVLGLSPADKDYVIEVNPRLTMSYTLLRNVCRFNIAEKIIQSRKRRPGSGHQQASDFTEAPN